MKTEAVERVTARYRRRLSGERERPKTLLDGFREAGLPIVYEPVKKVASDGG